MTNGNTWLKEAIEHIQNTALPEIRKIDGARL